MRLRRVHLSLLLAGALLAGQWLAAGHDADHGLQAAGHGCAVCVYAQHAYGGVLPALPEIAHAGSIELAVVEFLGAPLAARVRHHPIRGPPASSRNR
jgi:hypothetical protein